MGRVVAARARLEAIADEICGHLPCGYETCEKCANFVPGEGSAEADVVIVGEAPGASEDELGRPFVGAAGRLLDRLLEAAGLVREEVFITNVLKARPPGNRDLRVDEIAHHWRWLHAQLAVIDPRIVVPLGRHALARFVPGVKISNVHGHVIEEDGRLLLPMYHPAAALHGQVECETLLEDARLLGETLRTLRATA